MRGKRIGYLLAMFVFGLSMMTKAAPVFAAELGGWDENEGYYVNTPLARASSPTHTGKSETSTIGGTSVKRAIGQTSWSGVYHYTRARMEDIVLGINFGVLTDSGRIWGTSNTKATSPWWYFNGDTLGTARTYYGKDA